MQIGADGAVPFQAEITFKLYPREGKPEAASGFTIAKATRLPDGKPMTLKGKFGPVQAGETITIASGSEQIDPKYGPYFEVGGVSWADPQGASAVSEYLAESGCSPELAGAVARQFSLAEVDADPSVLDRLPGSWGQDLTILRDSWDELRAERRAMAELTAMGLEDHRARAAFLAFGARAVPVAKANPYLLTLAGIPFESADVAGRHLGIGESDPRRLGAQAALHAADGDQEGWWGLSPEQLAGRAGDGANLAALQEGIDGAVASGLLARCPQTGRLMSPEAAVIRGRLLNLASDILNDDPDLHALSSPARPEESAATDEQWQAVVNAYGSRLSILDGGPGTGKTTALKELLDRLDADGMTYQCLAPTGRAAVRISDQAGRPASTIHRRLGLAGMEPPSSVDEPGCSPERMLDEDVVIVDEASMLSSRLAERVLSHMSLGTRLVLVGDPGQLPPIGSGTVLLDLIESGRVPRTSLTKVFRQSQESLIVVNAHRINAGQDPYWSAQEASKATGVRVRDDWQFIEAANAIDAEKIACSQAQELPGRLGISPDDVMVASPQREGAGGVHALNRSLQDAFNPSGEVLVTGEKQSVRAGDRVMNTRNRYGKRGAVDVFNGDMGRALGLNGEGSLEVEMDAGHIAEFTSHEQDDIVPGYAATAHKLQGSESPAVICPVPDSASGRLLSRNLLYTAFTRPTRQCVVIGSKDTIRRALKVDGARVAGPAADFSAAGLPAAEQAALQAARDAEAAAQAVISGS